MAKKKQETLDLIVSAIKAHAPRSKESGSVEVSRSRDGMLSAVQYVLLTGNGVIDTLTGGIPFGRVTEVYGLEGCGKTGLVMRSAVRAQQRHVYERTRKPDGSFDYNKLSDDIDVSILYVDNEQSLDDDEKVIIEGTEIDAAVARCDTVDQLFKLIDVTINTLDAVEKAVKRPQFLVVIVDTIAGTSSKEEMTQDWNKDDYSRQPKMLRRAFRRLQRKINRRNVCMICTNQVSDSYQKSRSSRPGVILNCDFNTFGGKALKYYASLRLFMYTVPRDYKLIKKSLFPAGLLVGAFTAKNRMIKPLRTGRVVLLFEGGFHSLFSMLESFIFLKMAEERNNGSIFFRMRASGVELKAAAPPDMALEDHDVDGEERGTNPEISCRAEWPAFYKAHQAECDAFWEAARSKMFTVEGLDGVPTAVGDTGDDEPDADELPTNEED